MSEIILKDQIVIKKNTAVSPRLLRTKDAANYLGMSAWALRQQVNEGKLPFISSGEHTSSWKFDVGDLDAWVERHRVNF
jgi:excisionase family DNA binding protein